MNHRSIRLACLILSFCWAGFAKAEFVTNGSMTGPVGSEAIPPGWLAESDPSFYYSPSTIAPGGLTESGITVGQPLRDFRGVLTGVPVVEGAADLLRERKSL